jgi:hypothetical protein
MWVVDRLQCLGISRYFQPEIKECINYVYRHTRVCIYIKDFLSSTINGSSTKKCSDIRLMRGFAGREIQKFSMLMIRPWDSGYKDCMAIRFPLVSLLIYLLLFTQFSYSSRVIDIYWCFLFVTDVFQHFWKGDEFFCFAGQSSQAITGIFNLYRASQVVFPGEKILEDAKHFAFNFLREKQAANELFDKWIIMKDLPSEVCISVYIYNMGPKKRKKNIYNI